uniref:peptidoglycan editing factor PgeF n=1 Tax=Agathobacter sp. TaxID=2021311 RepID=UPI0040560244
MEFVKKNDKNILMVKEYELQNGTKMPLLHFPLLEETGMVNHCFTTRLGGVSEGDCAALNLSFARGDDVEAVEKNFDLLAEAMGVPVEDFVFSDQTHTTNILKVTSEKRGCGIVKEKDYSDIDGFITNEPNVMLSTFYADCVPLYFIDPVNKAIGLSHSGWKGTVGRMGQKTLEAMREAYGTNPADVICAIAPSICVDCYEVGEDVAASFRKEFEGREAEILIPKENGKYRLDLWKANEIVLLEAGIQKEHLAVTNICTCCNSKLLFSHRASRGRRGNLGAFLALKE